MSFQTDLEKNAEKDPKKDPKKDLEIKALQEQQKQISESFANLYEWGTTYGAVNQGFRVGICLEKIQKDPALSYPHKRFLENQLINLGRLTKQDPLSVKDIQECLGRVNAMVAEECSQKV